MINFEEELKRFHPSPEVEDAEEKPFELAKEVKVTKRTSKKRWGD